MAGEWFGDSTAGWFADTQPWFDDPTPKRNTPWLKLGLGLAALALALVW